MSRDPIAELDIREARVGARRLPFAVALNDLTIRRFRQRCRRGQQSKLLGWIQCELVLECDETTSFLALRPLRG
jgi:hypothetical protein